MTLTGLIKAPPRLLAAGLTDSGLAGLTCRLVRRNAVHGEEGVMSSVGTVAAPTTVDDVFALNVRVVADVGRGAKDPCTTNDGCAPSCASSCTSNV